MIDIVLAQAAVIQLEGGGHSVGGTEHTSKSLNWVPTPFLFHLPGYCERDVTADLIKMAFSSFHHLTELHVKMVVLPASLSDPVSFCSALKSSCTGLVQLSFSHVELGNHDAAEILRGMRAHPSLKSIM